VGLGGRTGLSVRNPVLMSASPRIASTALVCRPRLLSVGHSGLVIFAPVHEEPAARKSGTVFLTGVQTGCGIAQTIAFRPA